MGATRRPSFMSWATRSRPRPSTARRGSCGPFMTILDGIYGFLARSFRWVIGRRPPPQVDGPPVHRGDFPDPHVLRVGSTFYAYATQTGDTNVQVMRSSDLVTWDHLGDALPGTPGVVGYPAGGARSLHLARIGFVNGRPAVERWS